MTIGCSDIVIWNNVFLKFQKKILINGAFLPYHSLEYNYDFFKKIVIVRKDIKPYSNEQGITIIGIRHFLLNNNSLEF